MCLIVTGQGAAEVAEAYTTAKNTDVKNLLKDTIVYQERIKSLESDEERATRKIA